MLISVILPNISLLGHLSGMLFGVALMVGLDECIFPSHAYLDSLESNFLLGKLASLPGFVRSTGRTYSRREAVLGAADGSSSRSLTAIWTFMAMITRYFLNAVDTLLYIVNCPSTAQIGSRLTSVCNFGAVYRRLLEWISARHAEHEHNSDGEGELAAPTLGARIQRGLTSGRDRDGRGQYAPLNASTASVESIGRAGSNNAVSPSSASRSGSADTSSNPSFII